MINKKESTTTASGLQYLITSKGDGPAVTSTYKAVTHYAVYFEDGTLLETSMLRNCRGIRSSKRTKKISKWLSTLPADVSDEAAMIPGFKEGFAC